MSRPDVLQAALGVAIERLCRFHPDKQVFVFGPSGEPFWAKEEVAQAELDELRDALAFIERVEKARSRPFVAVDAPRAPYRPAHSPLPLQRSPGGHRWPSAQTQAEGKMQGPKQEPSNERTSPAGHGSSGCRQPRLRRSQDSARGAQRPLRPHAVASGHAAASRQPHSSGSTQAP